MPYAQFVALHGSQNSLVIDCRQNAPAIVYWGALLDPKTDYTLLTELNAQQEAPASAEHEPTITLSPTYGEGFCGQVGLSVHRGPRAWGVYLKIKKVRQSHKNEVTIVSEDVHNQIMITHTIELDVLTDVICAQTTLENQSSEALNVDWCAAPTFAIPMKFSDILSYEGRWAKEFQHQKRKRFKGTYLRENRKGRTSHDSFPALLLTDRFTDDLQGEAIAFHLAWSGNHRLCVEELHDGRVLAQMGELLFPGEIILKQGEPYKSPLLYATYSDTGLNGISHHFHSYVRDHLLSTSMRNKPRPVHFNTWEALYFDHDHDKLMHLVDDAADIGAERFVLDDGWFNGRRSDTAGLGDWYVDNSVYPDGLKPLIEKVNASGMEFGLWFEPEMVNSNSDLYRQHPDWVLQLPNAPQIIARNQLVLDLTQKAVCDYLFERINSLLHEYNIAYIKWDMNRDVHQPASANGAAAMHRQTHALYQLIKKIRSEHTHLEIESCASGGGRADFGIIAHTDRVWTSDSNDAIDRLSIQRGFSMFFPPELMGAHVGPFDCHITGRKIDIATRASTAIFGHMGMEVNLLEMDPQEKSILKNAITLHKQYRHMLHNGKLVRFLTNDYSDSFAVFSENEKTALFSYTDTLGHTTNQPSRYIFHNLKAKTKYSVELIWPESDEKLLAWKERFTGKTIYGEVLIQSGIQLPIINPQTSLIFKIEAI